MDTFPLPDADGRLEPAHIALEEQQAAVDEIVGQVAARANAMLDGQARVVNSVKARMRKTATQRLKMQQGAIDGMLDTMNGRAVEALNKQQMVVDDLTAAAISSKVPKATPALHKPQHIPTAAPAKPAGKGPCDVPWYVIKPTDPTRPCYISYTKDGDPARPGYRIVTAGFAGFWTQWQGAVGYIQQNCQPVAPAGQPPYQVPFPVGAPYPPPGCQLPPMPIGAPPPPPGAPGSAPPAGGQPLPAPPVIAPPGGSPGDPRGTPGGDTVPVPQPDCGGPVGRWAVVCDLRNNSTIIAHVGPDGCYEGIPNTDDYATTSQYFATREEAQALVDGYIASGLDICSGDTRGAPGGSKPPAEETPPDDEGDEDVNPTCKPEPEPCVDPPPVDECFDGGAGRSTSTASCATELCGSGTGLEMGSQEWFRNIEHTIAAFHAIGAYILSPSSSRSDLNPGSLTGMDNIAFTGVALGIEAMKDVLKWGSDQLSALVQEWYKVIEGIAPRDPCALLGVWFTRWCLSTLSNVEVGIHFIAGVRIHLHVESAQLDALLNTVANYLAPSHLPSPNEVWHAYRNNAITRSRANDLLLAQGLSLDACDDVLIGSGESLTPHDMIQLRRRQKVDDKQIAVELHERYTSTVWAAESMVELYDELPTIQEHLHWLQRNVFDEEYVKDYNLMQGFEEKFWPRYGPDLRARGMKKEYAEQHYAAHWLQPSPTQMKEFVYRLAPGMTWKENEFTTTDFERLLLEQDYAPRAIKWFAETVYAVPAATYTREMYQLSIIDDDELALYLRKQGYDTADVERMGRAASYTRNRIRASQSHGFTATNLGQFVRNDVVEYDQAERALRQQGYSLEEIDGTVNAAELQFRSMIVDRAKQGSLFRLWKAIMDAHATGFVSDEDAQQRLTQVGWPESAAQTLIAAANVQRQTKNIAAIIKAARKAFMDAEVTEQQVIGYLQNAGITPDRALEYATTWATELDAGDKQVSASQALSLLRDCLITPAEARQRLVNLGWADPDSALLVIQAQRKCDQKVAAADRAAQRTRKAAARELERIAKEMERERKKVQRELMRQEPMGLIKRLYIDGRLTDAWVERRLSAAGYDGDAITAHLRDWKDARNTAERRWESTHGEAPPKGQPGG